MKRGDDILEVEEYPTIAQWLDLHKFVYTHTAQSTFTTKRIADKLKKYGVRKGLPDYVIIIPYWWTGKHHNTLLFAEIKRRNKKLANTSKAQKEWIVELMACNSSRSDTNILAGVFYGADELIEYIESLS